MATPFETEMDKLTGTKPIDKIEILLDSGTVDITDYYRGGAIFDQKREIAPDRISAGDTTYTFSNHDDKFTETDSGSIFYGENYHNRKIRFSEGFILPDGSKEYAVQSTAYIKDVSYDFAGGLAYIKCMDLARYLIDAKMNIPPADTLTVPDAANVGDGTCSEVDVKPFATVNENWTLTCTTGGGDGTAIFSVVGSVSGNIGNATSGTEFSDATYGVKFKIEAGGTAWSIGDKFTFSTHQFPEWTNLNPVKIIWSLLTGTTYDAGANENFKSLTIQLDSTRSAANPDINWASFQTAEALVYTPVTGYIPQDYGVAKAIEELHILFLGALTIDPDGKVKLRAFHPTLGAAPRNFADTKKISGRMRRHRKVPDVINSVSCKTKRSATWAWSDASETYDYVYVKINSQSISDYKETRHRSFTNRWLSVNWPNNQPEAQQWFVDRTVDRYSIPPIKVDFFTGLDGILTESGDIITVSDADADLTGQSFDVLHLKKDFVAAPKKIGILASHDTTAGIQWVFLGSDSDEGDGISPQAANFDSANDTDKQFCYLSQTGATEQPMYYLF